MRVHHYLPTAGFIALACLLLTELHAQPPIDHQAARKIFAEAEMLCQRDQNKLWEINLCGPMLFVDPATRDVVANQADSQGLLRPADGVYTGTLPREENIANTATAWAGTSWTEILWPLPAEEGARRTLIAHELFHRVQKQLGLSINSMDENAHLDTLQGRLLLQLEYRALAQALTTQDEQASRSAAREALALRNERYRQFPTAASQERALELNEGLAEYTGVRIGNEGAVAQKSMALHDLESHAHDATFVRSFAYATGPAYGLLLDRFAPQWKQQVRQGAKLDELLAVALNQAAAPPDAREIREIETRYGSAALLASETERAEQRQKVMAEDRARFVTGPVLQLPLMQMSIQFNPQNQRPLEGVGTIYPTLRVSDLWGVLEADGGAMVQKDWSWVSVPAPAKYEGNALHGEGWTLTLKPGWKLQPGKRPGDLEVQKNPEQR
jgi:hypothetical protein